MYVCIVYGSGTFQNYYYIFIVLLIIIIITTIPYVYIHVRLTRSMTTEIVAEKSEYQIVDEADARQIANAEQAVKEALCYEVYSRGGPKKILSYAGIKWLVLKMSQNEQSLVLVGEPKVTLEKSPLDDTYIWYATVIVRNTKTGLETIGAQESPYLETIAARDEHGNPTGEYKSRYDVFGRTKALSKAACNAYRQQIPELEVQALLDAVDPTNVEKINSNVQHASTQKTNKPQFEAEAPTSEQVNFLTSLSRWHGVPVVIPASKHATSEKIKRYNNAKKNNIKLKEEQA